jgi:hypothetical protein
MKIKATFVQDGKWWVAWTDDVPGALTQGATLEEALAISERLVAEGRIDPAKTAEAHRRLLVRLGVKSELESPQALATGSCCTPRACGNQARSVRHAER